MADSTQLGAPVGTGDKIATDDLGAVLGKAQWVKLMDGTDGGTDVIPGSAANGLRVDPGPVSVADGGALPAKGVQVGGTDGTVFQVLSTDSAGRANVNVNGTVPVSLTSTTNAGAAAKTSDYDSGAGTDTVTSFGIALPASGGAVQGGTSTNPVRTDPTGTTPQPVSGTVTATGPLTDAQLRASAVPVDSELPAAAALADGAGNPTTPTVGAGALMWNGTGWDRVRGDTTNGVDVDVTRVQGTVTIAGAVTNAGTFAVQESGGALTALQLIDDTVFTDDAAFTVATSKVNAIGLMADQTATDSVNEGDIGIPRMTLDRKQIATLGPSGDTDGLSKFHLVSAATTNATNVKASAGKLHGWYIYNSNAAARKVAFHNTAGTPTAGASVTDSFVIPPTSAANAFSEVGIAFATGIAITTVTGLADSDATAVAANDLIINLYYA